MTVLRPVPFNLRVFISSTFSDLEEHRQAAFEAIQSLGAHGDDMIYWSADERSGAQHSLDRIKQCDVVVLLVAHRYGYVAEGSSHSVTEMEYLAARQAHIPVLAFFLDDTQPWPPDRIQWEKVDQLKAFRRRVEEEVTRKLFRSKDELGRLVTQALALFMERQRAQRAESSQYQGVTLAVDSCMNLKTQPNATVQVGNAEDGLPLLLQVRRSRDFGPYLDALRSEMAGSADSIDALFSSFRQSLEAHAKSSWALEGIVPVQWNDGGERDLYVSGSNLSALFRSTLSSVLAHTSGELEHTAAPASRGGLARSVILNPASISPSKSPALQSEGGRNRFLGIEPMSGEIFSVGRDGTRWVQWRPFLFESIGSAFPAATVLLDDQPASRAPVSELPSMLMSWALRNADEDGSLDTNVTICVPRQQIVLLLAQVAQRVGDMHSQGLVHGDLKPANIILGEQGPVLIDAFSVRAGEVCPGWTPTWSAPEQVLGEPATAASDLYPIGRMIADVLGGELVGEVRKFRARSLVDLKAEEFDIFYNPSVYVHQATAIARGQALGAWQGLAKHCLTFAPEERPESAAALGQQMIDMADQYPLMGEVHISIPGQLRVATMPDGTQAVARVISDARDGVTFLRTSHTRVPRTRR
jgi:hypothetical protein